MNTTTKTTTTEERLLANRAAIREEIAACGARVRALLRDLETQQPEQGQVIADAQALADRMAEFFTKHGDKPFHAWGVRMNTTTTTSATTTEERLLANRAAIREEIAACGARVRALLRDSEALQPEQGQAIADAQALADHMAAFVAKHGEFKQWCAEVKA